MLYELPATKLHPKGPLRIETDLDQEPSGLTDASPATRSILRNPPKFPSISTRWMLVIISSRFLFTVSIGCDIWRARRLLKAKHDRRRPAVSESGSTQRESA